MPRSKNGLAKTLAALDRVANAPREKLVPVLLKSANEFAGMAKGFAPVDSGALRDSIIVTGPGQSTPPYSQPGGSRVAGEAEVIVTAGNTDVRYAHLVEYGTTDTEAQSFFWISYRILKPKHDRRHKREARKIIKEAFNG